MRFFDAQGSETGFLDVSINRPGQSSSSFMREVHDREKVEEIDNAKPKDLDPEEEKTIDMAKSSESMSDKAEITVRRSMAFAEDACANSLTAAQVALWTEVIALFGGVAGILGAWFSWKQDDSEIPDELQVPDVGRAMPPVLMKPPPD